MTAPPFDRTRTVRVGDIDIAHVDVGAGDRAPIVLIHGFACGMRMWARTIPAFAARARVIAYDQRGHGRTTAPEDPAAYSGAHLARDLVGLLDALGIERVRLVGFSLGGGPSLAMALAQPQRVERLVLADVGMGADHPWMLTRIAQVWAGHLREGGWDQAAPQILRGDVFKRFAQRGPSSRRYMDALLRQHPVHGIVNTLDQVMARRKTLFRMRGPLAAVRVPTLVATGKFDFVCHKPERLFLSTIPGAVGARVPGAGHMAPVEQPAEFARIVGAFLFGAERRIDTKPQTGSKGSTRTAPSGSASRM